MSMKALLTLLLLWGASATSLAIPSKVPPNAGGYRVIDFDICGANRNEPCQPSDISNITIDQITSTSVRVNFTTARGADHDGNTTAYACVFPDPGSTPIESQVIAGSSPCVGSNTAAISVPGNYSITISGLTAGQDLKAIVVHDWYKRPFNELLVSGGFSLPGGTDPALLSTDYCIAAAGSNTNDGRCNGGTGAWATAAYAETQLSGQDGSRLFFLNTDTHAITNFDVQWSGTNATTGRAVIGAYYLDAGTPRVLAQDSNWTDNPTLDCSGAYCFRVQNEQYVTIQSLDIDGGPYVTDPDATPPGSVNSWLEFITASYIRVLDVKGWSATAQDRYNCIHINNVDNLEIAYSDFHMCGTHGDVRFGGSIPQKGDLIGTNYGSTRIWIHHNNLGFAGHSTGGLRSDLTVVEYNTCDPRLPNLVDGTDTRCMEINLDNWQPPDPERRVLFQANEWLNVKGVGARLTKFNVTGAISRYEYVDGNNARGPKADTCCYNYAQDIDTADGSMYNWTIAPGTYGDSFWLFSNRNPTIGWAEFEPRHSKNTKTQNFAVRATLVGNVIAEYNHPPQWQTTGSNYEGNTIKGYAFEIPLTSVMVNSAQVADATLASLQTTQAATFSNNVGSLGNAITTDQGYRLTTVISGCGTSNLTVERSRWFWGDALDITGDGNIDIPTDTLKINGNTVPAITAINDATNVITFASPVTCTNGQVVNHSPMDNGGLSRTGIPASITPGSGI